MSGEQGYRVATGYVALVVADDDLEAQVTAAIEAACADGGKAGGDAAAKEIAASVTGAGDEMSAALAEALAGGGDTAAAQVGAAFVRELGGAADTAAGEVASALQEAGELGGTQFAEQFDTATAGIGDGVAGHLDAATRALGESAGHNLGSAVSGGFADSLATIGVSSTALNRMTAAFSDAASEAGGAAGDALMGGLADSAGQSSAATAARVVAGIEAPLKDAMSAAGASAADAATASFGAVFSAGVADAITEANVAGILGDAFEALGVQGGRRAGRAAATSTAQTLADTAPDAIDVAAAFGAEIGDTVGSSYTTAVDTALSLANGTGAFLANGNPAFQALSEDEIAAMDAVAQQVARVAAIIPEEFHSIIQVIDGTVTLVATEIDGLSQQAIASLQRMAFEAQAYGGDAMTALTNAQINWAGLSSNPLAGDVPVWAKGPNANGGLESVAAAGEVESAVKKVGSAAKEASGGIASMMASFADPAMIGQMAMWTGMSAVLPLIGDLFKSDAVDASAFTAAIAQDSGAVGDNTAAVIQQSVAKQNLGAITDQLGVSQATLIEYAAGEKDAQDAVTQAYNAKQSSLNAASDAQGAHTRAQLEDGNAADKQAAALQNAKSTLDEDTTAVQQAIVAQNQQNAALLAAERSAPIYNAAVDSMVTQMRLQAQQASMTAQATLQYLGATGSGTDAYTQAVFNQSVALQSNARSAQVNAEALNQSLPLEGQLSQAAINASLAYSQAQQATSAYTSALTALYGQYGTTSQAQATFTTDLDGLSKSIKAGKDATDLSTAAGAANFATFQSASQAAQTYAEDLYQQTGNAGQATTALQQMATQLDTAATKAGFTTQQVTQLNEELWGVPKVTDIQINADTTPAQSALADVLKKINTSSGTIKVYESASGSIAGNNISDTITNTNSRVKANAAGGPVQAGDFSWVGENGPEIVQFGASGTVIPNHQIRTVGPGDAPATPAGSHQVNFNFYGSQLPNPEQMAEMRREFATVGAF